MILALLAGAGVGLGAVLVISALVPARPPLAVALERLHRPSSSFSSAPSAPGASNSIARLPHWLATALGADRLGGPTLASQLRITGQSLEDHVASRLVAALVGLALPPTAGGLMLVGGVSVSPALPASASLVLAAAGFFVPPLTLRAAADEARHSFRHALTSYLDLVAVSLAGGAGVETALHEAAETGTGFAFAELRQALLTARVVGQTPWSGLDHLGRELGIVELEELAASMAIAGEDGARVRASLAAKARSVRTRGLTDTEGAAQAATERMSMPIVVLMVGFMIFILFPALARIVGL